MNLFIVIDLIYMKSIRYNIQILKPVCQYTITFQPILVGFCESILMYIVVSNLLPAGDVL